MLLVEEKVKNKLYDVRIKSSSKRIGEFINIDGFFYYLPASYTSGVWSEEYLRDLTSELDKLNREVSQSIDQYFKDSKE